MDGAAFDAYTQRLVEWARGRGEVIGVVGLGSTAATAREPDRYSDHDLFVVTVEGAARTLRDDLGWLPDAERIAQSHADSEHGRAVVYDDGHLVEVAVFDPSELDVCRVNAYRILYDTGGIAERLAALASDTTDWAAVRDRDGGARFAAFVQQVIVGVNRHARGERLSAHQVVRGFAVGHLLALVRDFVPSEHPAVLDNLDPHRRFELAHPAIGQRIGDALERPVPELVELLVAVAEEHVVPRLPFDTGRPLAALRRVLDDVRATTEAGARLRW